MNRFFIPKYWKNSLRIKLKSIVCQVRNGQYPYAYFKDKIRYSAIPNFQLNYHDQYLSFGYFNYKMATKYYSNRASLIHSIMLSLIEYNDRLATRRIDPNKMILQANEISKAATYINGLPHFVIDEKAPKFNLYGKYHSGIIQAKASSFFLRVYKETKDEKYLHWAKSALEVCLIPKNEGGILIENDVVKCWAEEYNTDKPSMVLNGFIFTLIAAAEFLYHQENYDIRQFLIRGLETLQAWFPNFNYQNDFLYSMYTWDFANVHYMGVMKYQFSHLYKITGLSFINNYQLLISERTDITTFEKIIS